MRISLYRFLLVLFCSSLHAAYAEDPPEINLSLFCRSGVPASFKIGVTSDLKIGFTANFQGTSPADKMHLIFIDGFVENNSVKEQYITRMNCDRNESDTGDICTGNISIEREEKLAEKFNFDQAVINLSLRRGQLGKDYCLGKFTNDETKISANHRAVRTLCNFIPAEGQTEISGEGHFNPAGYGLEGNSHFHMSFLGLPTDRVIRACAVTGSGRYRQMLNFRSYDASASDADIYGDFDDDEQSEFEGNKIDYSYDLLRDLNGAADNDTSISFVPNLSQVNLGIGGSAANNATKKGNRARKRKRLRDKRQGTSRRILRSPTADAQIKATTTKEDVFKWLSFDPQAGVELYISDSCKGDVATNAYGRLLCGDADDIEETSRKCTTLTGDTGDGTACLEPRGNFIFANVRVRDLSDGEYTVCLDNQPVTEKLEIESDETGPYGILEITDSAILASEMPDVAYFTGEIEDVSVIGLSETNDCSTLILQGTL